MDEFRFVSNFSPLISSWSLLGHDGVHGSCSLRNPAELEKSVFFLNGSAESNYYISKRGSIGNYAVYLVGLPSCILDFSHFVRLHPRDNLFVFCVPVA